MNVKLNQEVYFLTWKKSIVDKTNGTLTITGLNIDFDDSACDLIIS